jgi:dipeptidyl-peptidase-4
MNRHILATLVTGVLMSDASAAEPAARPARAPLGPEYLRQHALTRGFMLGRPVKPKPTPDGKAVLFLRAEARVPKMRLYEFDVATKQTRELLSPESLLRGAEEALSPEEKARRERQRVSVGGFTDFQLADDGRLVLVSLSGKLYVFDRTAAKVRELKTGRGVIVDPKFSPDSKLVGYVRDHDVYVYDLAADTEKAVTTGGTEAKTHGLAEFVAQEEMGRFSGWWWSPDGKHIAYEEADAAGVEVWYVADPAKPEQSPHPQFYPRPGRKNVAVRLGVVPVAGGETVWVKWDREKYPYLGSVRWDKHGPLTVVVQDRKQQEQLSLLVTPHTGGTALLGQEWDKAWVNLHQDFPRFLSDGKRWLQVSEVAVAVVPGGDPAVEAEFALRYPRLDVTGGVGTLGAGFTPRTHVFQKLVDFNEDARQLVYTASTAPGTSQVYRVSWNHDLRPNAPHPLTNRPGDHTAVASSDHSTLVITGTTPGELPRTTVHQADGTEIGTLPSVAETPDFTPNVEFTKVGNSDGYFAAVVRPHGFDPAKKYPVIVDVYGGPHHLTVVKAMRNWLLDQWLADQGFVVVALDNRGTPGRGRDWERAVYTKFGTVPLDDQVAGLQALGKKYPFLDLQRVGIVGWSFGGYMSALAVLKRPDVFKAAVAGAPVTDWEDYDTHYTERYMGLPQDHPEAYKEASLLTHADKLSRPLLLVHGTADDNVFFRHSLKLAGALFRAGKEFELLPLSGLTHMVPDPVVTERLWTRVAGHFRKHLGKPE